MRPLNLLPALVAIAFAPALSHAAETYTGTARADFGTENKPGQFELTVNGSKIGGRVFSPVLKDGFRVHGAVDHSGKFSLRASDLAVKGRISGTLRAGHIQGKGRLSSSRQDAATITLAGKTRALTVSPESIEGTFVCTPGTNWDGVLYSWAKVTMERARDGARNTFRYSVILAGKGEGDRWDEMQGFTFDGPAVADRITQMGVNNFTYVIPHPVRDSRAKVKVTLVVETRQSGQGQPKVVVIVDAGGWDFISPDTTLPKTSRYEWHWDD